MLKISLLIGLLFTSFFSYGQRNIDIVHYNYDIRLSDHNDSIYGEAVISLHALTDLQAVELDLVSPGGGKGGMLVTEISHSPPDATPLTFIQQGEKLVIKASLRKNDSAHFLIHYKGIPGDGLIISRNKFGKRTFFSDNWPDRAHYWIPCVDDPLDKASVDFIVTAPQHYRVVSNGILLEEIDLPGNTRRTHWKEEVLLPTKIMVIGVAELAVKQEGDINGIPVSTWVYPENRTIGFHDYAPAKEILSFFIDYIGPYPYKKLANVQSRTIFGGMENASVIFYNENYINGLQDQYRLMAHEITHQWFGDMVTEKNFTHLWLSEGFATYLAILYMQNKFGKDTATAMLRGDRREVIDFSRKSNKAVVDTLASYMELLNANSYEKGSWILHMLHHRLGDTVFQQCIREFYATYAGKNADSRDLQLVFEKISGKKLDEFFLQWLYMPGIPVLSGTWQYSRQEKKIIITMKQLQDDTFKFPVEIRIEAPGGEKSTILLQVSKQEQSFSIPYPEKPGQLTLDPDVHLLFDGNIKEGK